VPVEPQLILESKLNLVLYAAQDVGQITDELGIVKSLSHWKTESPYWSANGADVPWILCEGFSLSVFKFQSLEQAFGTCS
jgi:hypothetical protein